MDLPFDLNNLFSLQYSFDTLKVAIEYLARQQKEQANSISHICSNMLTKDDEDRLAKQKGSINRASVEHSKSGGRGSNMQSKASLGKGSITAPVSEIGDLSAMGASDLKDVPDHLSSLAMNPPVNLGEANAELDLKLAEGQDRLETGQRPHSKGDTEYYKDLLDRVQLLESQAEKCKYQNIFF